MHKSQYPPSNFKGIQQPGKTANDPETKIFCSFWLKELLLRPGATLRAHSHSCKLYIIILLSISSINCLVSGRQVGGDFGLTSHRNEPYSLADSRDQVVLLLFGFTHCPDVCPQTLETIQAVSHQIGDRAYQVQPLFITVDPERDTPEILRAYCTTLTSRSSG